MIEFLKVHQLNIMLALSSVCGVIALFVCVTRNLSSRRKFSLFFLEVCSALMLTFDRLAYIYRGNESVTGYWMVRISNFMVFSMILTVIFLFNMYLADLVTTEGGFPTVPKRLWVGGMLSGIGELLIIVSQFTGFYYTFDETNHYQRAPGFIVCYIIPVLIYLIQLSVIIQYCRKLNRPLRFSLILFTVAPVVASLLQLFAYGVSLISIAIVGVAVVLYLFALIDMGDTVERANRIQVEYLKEEQQSMQRLFEQTATALVNAIDAKDTYTHGHSGRVADYSRQIAQLAGKSEEECDEIYYAALLHDVGKIGIANSIINKDGKLTDKEYEAIKQHTVIGKQILSSISEFPYISIAANYHHERYDGKGYPEHRKGEDIPEIARIISVADAYDAMTSKRSYRDPIPQQKVREEFVKGAGTQFDPVYAKIILHMIDLDTDYQMKEKEDINELAGKNELICGEYRAAISEGIIVTSNISRIHLKCRPLDASAKSAGMPALILFDSLDGRVYDDEKKIKDLNYLEYGEIWFDGHTICTEARKMQTDILHYGSEASSAKASKANKAVEYDVEAVKFKDHALLKISSQSQTAEIIVALPDSARFVYIGLTGEHCHISDVQIQRSEETIKADYIPRIAEEITYIDRVQGDIPNIQVDGYRWATTAGIPITDGMSITFHTMSLPTARLVWHCPYIVLFSSDDKLVNGPNYREFSLIRLDGEEWESDEHATNKMIVNKNDEFESWDAWKRNNKAGVNCVVTFRRKGNKITTSAEMAGISLRNDTTIADSVGEVYAALTGDQCALTDIRIKS